MSTSQQPTAQPKQTARERLAEAHRVEAHAAARRRRVTIAVSAAAVLALVGGTAVAISTASDNTGSGSDRAAVSSAPVVTPANASGTDGTVVVYGRADAPHTLKVYEDFRCPVCRVLEESAGKTMQQLADNGTYKIEYHLAAFLDNGLGGKGSMTALAAAGAALNEGPDKFKQFHDVLYANQPEERVDGFGDVNHLLDLAGKVPGLKTDAFTKAVTEGTYRPWAAKVAESFNSSGVRGTPTVLLDGKQLDVFDGQGKPVTADQYTALIRQHTGG
ncbi:thioredoxin domain-containing protein [Kitasatospora sp. McL0602]|uniref:thioredoxin domain-containing protein n=1 Tax=Kitasatospora sp. McL0602 TaxID=3439530 RepID=UPI003F88C8A7